MASNRQKGEQTTVLYRIIWRWHFYAGLCVIPMVLLLSVTGGFFLFKPQVEHWEERAFQNLPIQNSVSPSYQRDAALAAFPGAEFLDYRLPEKAGNAALIRLRLQHDDGMRDVFVSPQGEVKGALNPAWRPIEIARTVHGQLLLGPRGSWLVELAASWAIALIVTGLYLWWPSATGLAGVVWPRFSQGRRVILRDLHAVTGFWVSGLALVLLFSGLPWAGVWGSAFQTIRTEMGWISAPPDWTIGGEPADAGEHAIHMRSSAAMQPDMYSAGGHMPMAHKVGLDQIVDRAGKAQLAFPVIVTPPGMSAPNWIVRSDSQSRPLRVTMQYDAKTGREVSREAFADKHVIDRVIGYGVAWHEGQLFGWVNQLVGVLTACALVTMAITGFLSWRRRKPVGRLGAPKRPDAKATGWGLKLLTVIFLMTLPMFALSIAVLWLFERLALPRFPALRRWLAIPRRPITEDVL